ncbi:sulfotransferase family 2 domain-containing protein [Oceanicella actignis]|uniref:Sulfotransferase family protein n=1 Tax=Oceanicella actignis TaxID=1189325 RepID=A0A1M7TYJ2_9RHOB|nr:sulfotransferase family 2 domain-containing protein [Oceanicella actignis]SET81941.1 Sulfotransferase family protein [Oceanicella actignis]SHN75774.1 Sulfotransferase family protein [Oceanicella actignis]
MSEPIHFFVHVPKCAGTTVERHFDRTLGEGFMIAPRWNNPLRDVLGNRARIDPERAARVRVMSGHSLARSMRRFFPGRELRESVLLRDPVGYLLSFYNYRVSRHLDHGQPAPPPFDDWLAAQRRNPISRFLLMRYFEIGYPRIYAMSSRARFAFLDDALRGFHFVGGHKRCDEVVGTISRELGVDDAVTPQNVGRRRVLRAEDLGEEQRARILERNDVDAALFARWADRGFGPGAPAGGEEEREALLESLSGADQPDYLLSDLTSLARKKLWRPF